MLTATEGLAADWDVAAWFADPDADDSLTFTVSGLPAWLTFDSAMGSVTIADGATDDAQVGTHEFEVTATDNEGAMAIHRATLTVENVNEAPFKKRMSSAMLTATEGLAFSVDVSDWFDDPDLRIPGSTEVLTYAATLRGGSPLPNWLELDQATGALTIAAGATDDDQVGNDDNGNKLKFMVTATDAAGETVARDAVLTVENVNDSPVTTSFAPTSTKPLMAIETGVVMWNVSDWFTDPDLNVLDANERLAFTVSGLPAWLIFDSAMRSLTIAVDGATNDADVGTHEFEVTATDVAGAMAVHTAVLTIENFNEAPVLTGRGLAILTAVENASHSWDVSGWFNDPDFGASGVVERLTYTATLQKGGAMGMSLTDIDWLELDQATGALTIETGETDDDEVGLYTLKVTATDVVGETISHTAMLTVENVNDAPFKKEQSSAILTAMEGDDVQRGCLGLVRRPRSACPGQHRGVRVYGDAEGWVFFTELAGAGPGDGGSDDSGGSDGRRRSRYVRI